ncbi:MAG: hypothetical protein JRH20_17755 [Deltaproteobacteria bacterium]|nr:hypothetical protein [Deltaproteobacteria bacterium]
MRCPKSPSPLLSAALVLGAFLPLGGGCKGLTKAPPPKTAEVTKTQGIVKPLSNARAFTLTTRLAVPQAHTFTRLDASHARALGNLVAASTQQSKIFAAEGRLLILPPKNHPAAGLELLLDSGENRLDVRLPDGRIVRLLASALVDVLDRALPSKRGLGEDPMHGGIPQLHVQATNTDRALGEQWKIDAPLRFHRRDLAAPWSLRVHVTLSAATTSKTAAPSSTAPSITPLCPLILPLILGVDEIPAGLTLCPGRVQGWKIALENSDRESRASACFETSVDEHGWGKPSESVKPFKGRVDKAWRVSGPDTPGAQHLDAKALAAIRPSGPTGTLTVDNRSRVAALVYLEGALLGWVAAGRKMHFKGVPHSFFQVFATAPSGVRAWGPKALYVPGTLTLD